MNTEYTARLARGSVGIELRRGHVATVVAIGDTTTLSRRVQRRMSVTTRTAWAISLGWYLSRARLEDAAAQQM